MSVRPIGEIVAPIVARAANIALLNQFLALYAPSDRKRAIMVLWENELISGDAAELLIEHNQLEAA